jgi:hypothetical protein
MTYFKQNYLGPNNSSHHLGLPSCIICHPIILSLIVVCLLYPIPCLLVHCWCPSPLLLVAAYYCCGSTCVPLHEQWLMRLGVDGVIPSLLSSSCPVVLLPSPSFYFTSPIIVFHLCFFLFLLLILLFW